MAGMRAKMPKIKTGIHRSLKTKGGVKKMKMPKVKKY